MGIKNVLEDCSRLHYERDELACFEGIECQWPLFLAFELLTACLEERWELAHSFQQRLQGLAVSDGQDLLQPELYLLPEEAIAAERRYPGSQQRQANENVPLLWTQSLWLLGQLLLEGLIQPADLDPCGRRQRRSLGCRQVRVVLVPGDAAVAEALAQEGLPMATPGDGGWL